MKLMAKRNRDETIWEALAAFIGFGLLIVVLFALLYVLTPQVAG